MNALILRFYDETERLTSAALPSKFETTSIRGFSARERKELGSCPNV